MKKKRKIFCLSHCVLPSLTSQTPPWSELATQAAENKSFNNSVTDLAVWNTAIVNLVLKYQGIEYIVTDHRCGHGVTSLLLTQWVRVRSPVGTISWLRFSPRLSLNRKSNVRKFGPHSSPVIIWPSYIIQNHTSPVYGRRRSLIIAVVHGRR